MTNSESNSLKKLHPEIAVRGDGELAARAHAESPHPYRSPFARDAARILHARAFRRLAGKTQVFPRQPAESPSDHFRSRLTHTLEVTQISRTLAGALGLNIELTEALALAHDIGHPPFGHAGEKALDHCLRGAGLTFDHNLHALRIVTWFEERYAAFRGLNLTLAVREGIVKHSHDYSRRLKRNSSTSPTRLPTSQPISTTASTQAFSLLNRSAKACPCSAAFTMPCSGNIPLPRQN
jgi:dGTPase